MRLVHFSQQRLDVVDPQHYGKQPWTSPSEKRNAHFPRAYFYRQQPKRQTAVEPYIVAASRYGHRAEVKLAIYDFGRDPLDMAKVADSSPWRVVEETLREAGYQGFRDSSRRGYMRDVVAVWEPIPVATSWRMP